MTAFGEMVPKAVIQGKGSHVGRRESNVTSVLTRRRLARRHTPISDQVSAQGRGSHLCALLGRSQTSSLPAREDTEACGVRHLSAVLGYGGQGG